MIKLQQNRYLWVHFASLAFVPLLLDICLAGLASAGPALPFGGQFWAIALLSIAPSLAMQWFKPFYIFALPPVALRPTVLSEDQRRCLQIFKSWQIKALAIAVAIFSLWLLAQLYEMLPQVSAMLSPSAGLMISAIAFFWAAAFMQISVSAARALLISPKALQRVPAVDEGAIASDFLIAGIRVDKLWFETSANVEVEPNKSNQLIDNSALVESEPTSIPTVVEATQEEIPPLPAEPLEVAEPTTEISDETVIVIPEAMPPEKANDLPT